MKASELKAALLAEVFRINKSVAFGLQANIVRDTPIDTGRAKASWRLNENEADTSVEPPLADVKNFSTGAIIESAGSGEQPLSAVQAASIAEAQQQKIGNAAAVIVISNNLNYIEGLEDGNSKQAPQGMVTKNVSADEVKLLIDTAIAEKSPF